MMLDAHERGAPREQSPAIGQLEYMISEIDTWSDLLPPGLLAQLRLRYAERLNRARGQTQLTWERTSSADET